MVANNHHHHGGLFGLCCWLYYCGFSSGVVDAFLLSSTIPNCRIHSFRITTAVESDVPIFNHRVSQRRQHIISRRSGLFRSTNSVLKVKTIDVNDNFREDDRDIDNISPRPSPAGEDNNKNRDDEEDDGCYSVQVTYEDRTIGIRVRRGETVLSALERSGVADRLLLPSGSLPSDCRRGSCLTCSGRHLKGSSKSNVKPVDGSSGKDGLGRDGLSPSTSRHIDSRGYVLTCSSTVVGPGVRLQLGENESVWGDVQQDRFQDESAQILGRTCVARAMRLADEKNFPGWIDQAERMLEIDDNKKVDDVFD